jgi:hypothetical protein
MKCVGADDDLTKMRMRVQVQAPFLLAPQTATHSFSPRPPELRLSPYSHRCSCSTCNRFSKPRLLKVSDLQLFLLFLLCGCVFGGSERCTRVADIDALESAAELTLKSVTDAAAAAAAAGDVQGQVSLNVLESHLHYAAGKLNFIPHVGSSSSIRQTHPTPRPQARTNTLLLLLHKPFKLPTKTSIAWA